MDKIDDLLKQAEALNNQKVMLKFPKLSNSTLAKPRIYDNIVKLPQFRLNERTIKQRNYHNARLKKSL